MKKKRIPRSGLPHGSIPPEVVRAGVDEILQAVSLFSKKPLKQLVVLDAGCGRGEYAAEIAKHVKEIVGVEPQPNAVEDAKVMHKKVKNLTFFNSNIEEFKSTKKFDLVVSLTVFEHMSAQKKSFKRIFELLKDGGIIYLTAPNKYWIFEQHYGLPFLSWLPLPLANFYLNNTKGVKSYEDCSYSKGYFGMMGFFDQFKCRYEFILPFNPKSEYFGCSSGNVSYNTVRNLGINLIKLHPIFWSISKGFIMVIRKKAN